MINLFRTLLFAVASLALFAVAPAALADRGVNDAANFFTDDGKRQATTKIDDIYRSHHGQEVFVETAQAVPEGQDYAKWADEKTRGSRTNGLYLLIVRKGAHVHLAADTEAARLFTNPVRTDLAKRLRDRMPRAGDQNPKQTADAALLDFVSQVGDRYQQGERQPGGTNAPRSQGAPGAYPPSGGSSGRSAGPTACGALPGSFMGWLCLIAGVWIVFGLIRGVFANRGGGSGPGGPGPGYGGYGGGGYGGGYGGGGFGGGGWGSSILGGMFGAVAGNWLYDRFSGGHGGSAYGAPPADTGYGGAAGPSSPDWAGPTDTSSGYESSDAGGGGDFGGGGDSGGGGADFGGGGGGADFGGGGSDFGGGGGDSGGGDFA